MRTDEIIRILQKKIPETFIGVFARNKLPKRVPFYPCSLVVNLDSGAMPGSHWTAIHFDGNAKASYMDSFGLPPFVPHIMSFMKRNSSSVWINRKLIQHFQSNNCGEYCIIYLLHRNKGKSNQSYLKMFKKPELNEKLIERKFNRIS